MLTDVAHQRCCSSHLYGMPAKIATTDKFQGQQNDYILLSLVRTKVRVNPNSNPNPNPDP